MPDNIDYSRLIKGWHNKAARQKDWFSKFVFEYLSFIAYLKKQKFENVKTDRGIIQELKRSGVFKKQYIEQVKKDHSSWDRVIENLSRTPIMNDTGREGWWNCSCSKRVGMTDVERAKRIGVIHSLDDWENMVEFWYAIRNNLFHGAKDPESERDQFMAEYGYKTLRELMKLYL